MGWIVAATVSAAIHGAVNVIDSHLLSRRMPSFAAFLLPVGIVHFIYACIVYALFPFPQDVGMGLLGLGLLGASLRAGGITIMLRTLTREDVVRVIPVIHTYPIFVAGMAVALLGEPVRWLQWMAILMVVGGVVLISLDRFDSGFSVVSLRPVLYLLAGSLLFAGADVVTKYALTYLSFWNIYSLNAFLMASVFLAISARPKVLARLLRMEGLGSAAGLLVFNELLAPVGALLLFWAMQRGPVSLVSTIVSSRPLFVFAYVLVLMRTYPQFLHWQPRRETLAVRLLATALIVAGISMIHLWSS